MKKFKKILSIFLFFTLLFSISISAFTDGSDNADTGSGSTGNKVDGKGFYRSGEWMYKVSVYVGLSDKVDTRTSLSSGYKMIGKSPIFVKPSNFVLPDGVIFGKSSKVNYIKGAGLESNPNPKIVTDNPPPPPITNGGTIGSVKSYFGDTGTLIRLIDAFAQQKGTTREGLVMDIEFTIDGKKGKQSPKDILPIKDDKGRYQNKVPWVIIYEPVTIAHLKDGKTKLAFTATEYAIAQQIGAFDFFYSSSQAQYIAGMTHANLPNSIVLERDWFGYKRYPPLPPKKKWDNDRIIQGGGWGMRWLAPNSRNIEEPIEPPNIDNEDGDYRVDTDVITSFRVKNYSEEIWEKITPSSPASVTFRVDGKVVGKQYIVLPLRGSQLTWIKWHTPKEPKTVTVTATISGGNKARFEENRSKTISKEIKVVDLNENVPPDPRAMDYETGKAIEKPRGWKVPKLPRTAKNTSASWGEWSATWIPPRDEDDEGYWKYTWNSYYVDLDVDYRIKPDEKVPTAKQYFQRWEMKSGYGLNIEADGKVRSNASSHDYTFAQTMVNYFPEFNYENYWRLSERTKKGWNSKFQLQKNKYSPNEQRVHYTPLWFPDNEKYTPYSEVIDVWTPSGMLSLGLSDYIEIKGNVFDDWIVVPGKVE